MKGNACVPALKALGDETRLRIVRLLAGPPLNVGEISGQLEISQFNTSKHLRVLKEAGLVTCEKQGRQRLYGIPDNLRDQLESKGGVLDLGCCTFRFDQLPK